MTPLEAQLCAAVKDADPSDFGALVLHSAVQTAHNNWRNTNVTVANPVVSVVLGRKKLEELFKQVPNYCGIRIYFTNSSQGLRDVCIVPVDNTCKNIINPCKVGLNDVHTILNTSTPCPDICESL